MVVGYGFRFGDSRFGAGMDGIDEVRWMGGKA